VSHVRERLGTTWIGATVVPLSFQFTRVNRETGDPEPAGRAELARGGIVVFRDLPEWLAKRLTVKETVDNDADRYSVNERDGVPETPFRRHSPITLLPEDGDSLLIPFIDGPELAEEFVAHLLTKFYVQHWLRKAGMGDQFQEGDI
jgi:hypothetical protein